MSLRVPPPAEGISAAQARRIVLAAQGFGRRRLGAAPGRARLLATIRRLGLLQMDSVSVLVRAHYMPLFARHGPYAVADLDRLAYGGRRRRLFEYWGHEASLLPVELQPLMRWRMARAQAGQGIYGRLAEFGRARRPLVLRALAEIRDRGPLRAGDLEGAAPGQGSWWGWSEAKHALEWLFWAGLVTTAQRRGFERVYDLPERVLPRAVLDTPAPPEAEAQRALVKIAARALGLASERDLRDYFRLPVADARARILELVEAGRLLPVAVEGWKQPAYLDPEAPMPRRVAARALLAPFDSLVFERARAERLFGFRYRIEIYTPAHKRTHGYYVLPFLLGERLVARVDLKAERGARCLQVLAVHGEPGVRAGRVVPPLLDELRLLAGWLGLERLEVARRGDLAGTCRDLLPPAGALAAAASAAG